MKCRGSGTGREPGGVGTGDRAWRRSGHRPAGSRGTGRPREIAGVMDTGIGREPARSGTGRAGSRRYRGRAGSRRAALQHRGEHPAAGGPARWHLLLPPAPGPRVLPEVRAGQGGEGSGRPRRCGPGRRPARPCSRSEKLLKLAASIPRESLVAPGTCFGKFTKSQKFRLSVTALDFLAPYAKVGHGPTAGPGPVPAPRLLTALPLSPV